MQDIFKGGIIDQDTYTRLVDFNDSVFLEEMVDVFLQQNEIYITKLDAACENRNSLEVRKILHSMQGSASTVGATKMISSILKVRAFTKSEDYKNMQKFIKQLKLSYSQTSEALNRLLSVT